MTLTNIATDCPAINANDLVMAKAMADALCRHYPGHQWAVACNGATGMADVYNLGLSGNRGYRLRLPTLYSASEFEQRVVRAGGEILERYRLSRGRLNPDAYANLPSNFAGHFMFDQ